MIMLALVVALALVTLDATLVTVIVSVVAPLLVALVTAAAAPAWLKRLVSGFLAVAVGVVVTATTADGSAIISMDTVVAAFISFAVQQVSYISAWSKAKINEAIAPSFGLKGSPPP